jgi:hypothetical protein
MLNTRLLSKLKFKQHGHSCVLATYAVAAYPFTETPVDNYFRDYCSEFKVPSENPEQEYVRHFGGLLDQGPRSGYEIIRDLHNFSKKQSFSKCEKMFSLELIKDVSARQGEITSELRSAVRNALIVFLNAEQHSIVVFFGTGGLSFYQTRAGDIGDGLRSISELGELGEGLMLRERKC